jgi:hypothetical protein
VALTGQIMYNVRAAAMPPVFRFLELTMNYIADLHIVAFLLFDETENVIFRLHTQYQR